MEKRKSEMLVTSTPHIRQNISTRSIMLDVIIALLPAIIMGTFFFGIRALYVIGVSVASCVLFEYLYRKIMKKTITIYDCSAIVSGLLLAFNLPASAPLWLPMIGSFFAIVVVKQLFGGIGQNFMNPALAARAFLLASYPTQMTDWSLSPVALQGDFIDSAASAISSATPLARLKMGVVPNSGDFFDAFIGRIGGTIGETCAIALLIGGVYLILRKVISWRIPVCYLGTAALLSWIIGRDGLFTGLPHYELVLGGLMLGAFFMATDYSSSPITNTGRIIMGVGCGALTVIIRRFGGYPEGVSYAILLMNLAVPLIDKFTKPKVYGEVPKHG